MPPVFTPRTVIETATPDPNEILVAGVDANNVPRNVLLRNHAQLRASLIATPRTLQNPAWAAADAALTAAIARADAAAAALGSAPELVGDPPAPNPDRPALQGAVTAASAIAAAALAARDAIDATIPNPDRAPLEQQAFDHAVQQLTPPA